MDLRATVDGLCGHANRSAGSDAERRAARWLRDRVQASGRDASFEVHWVRPHWSTIHLIHATAGVVGSLVATGAAVAGLVVAAAATLSTLLELTGRPSPTRLLSYRRATQNVVSPPPRARSRRVRLVVVAAYDAARRGLAFRPAFRRADASLRGSTGGWWPPPLTWLALTLVAVTLIAALRLAGYEPSWLAVVQLVPTVLLLLAIALLADISLSDPSPDASGASAVAVALELVEEIDAQPLARIDVELVLAGAGDGPALGAGAYVRRRRRRWDPARVAFLEIRPCGAGAPAIWATDGAVVPLRLHPRLVELASGAGGGAASTERGRNVSAAYRARQARWPALAVGALDPSGIAPHRLAADDEPDTLEPGAMEATVELCVALVAALDEDLASREAEGRTDDVKPEEKGRSDDAKQERPTDVPRRDDAAR